MFFALLLLTQPACRKEKTTAQWNTDLLVPLAKTELNISKFIPDTLLKVSNTGALSISYQQTLLDTSLAGLAQVPDTTIKQAISLGDLKLSSASLSKSVSLGQICESSGITGATIIANNGGLLSVPSMNTSSTNTQNIDATNVFDAAYIQGGVITEGYMDIKLTNNFPIDITHFVFSITNQSDNSLIVKDSFALLPKNGGNVVHTLPLAGLKIESHMIGTILNISSPGSGGASVMIDTSQTSVFDITIRDVKVKQFTAIFTNKQLLNFNYELKLLESEAQLQYVDLDKGTIHIHTENAITENFNGLISSPKLSKNGKPFSANCYIKKSQTAGSYAPTDIDIDLAGYRLDLRGSKPNGYNTIQFTIAASVDSTGIPSTITDQDSVRFYFTFKDFAPAWAQGYFGRSSYTYGPTNVLTNVFKKITYGHFKLDKLKLGFTIENGIGVNAQVSINTLAASNTNNKINLAGPVANKKFTIARATDNPYLPRSSSFELNESNSNLLELIEMMPNALDYSLQLDLNPGGNVGQYKDFFYKQSRIKAILDVEAPLSFGFDLLTLADTVDFSIGTLDAQKRINEGLIKLLIDNGYPFDAFVTVKLLDANNQEIDQLFTSNNWVKSGLYNSSNPVDCQNTRSTVIEVMNRERIDKLSKVKKAAFSISLVTDKTQVRTVYEKWKIGMKLVADFNYTVGGSKK